MTGAGHSPVPTAIVGPGSVQRVGEVLDAYEAESIFLVCGTTSFRASGADKALETALAGRNVTRFSAFSPNPSVAEVEAALAQLRATPHDAILAVGGGTAIDIAKLIALLEHQRAAPAEIARGVAVIDSGVDHAPVIAVPTTAGSGAEVTHFAVLYIDDTKYSVAHARMRPSYAIVDADLTHSVPARVTAATGLDALCQALEAMWSVRATPISSLLARESAMLALASLEAATVSPTAAARTAMAKASHLAGKAIDMTRTTAPHAVSYTMTSVWGVLHGHAVALTLGPLLAHAARVTDADVVHSAGPDHVRVVVRDIAQMLGIEDGDPDAASEQFHTLIARLGLPNRLSDLGICTGGDRQRVVDTVNAQRLNNHPRAVTPGALRRILDAIR